MALCLSTVVGGHENKSHGSIPHHMLLSPFSTLLHSPPFDSRFVHRNVVTDNRWAVAYPGILFGGGGGGEGGSTNSVEDRENGDLGVVAP